MGSTARAARDRVQSAGMSRIAVVDADNRFLRWEPRETVHAQHLPHRSVHVLLFDPLGRFISQRRLPQKLTYADCWDIACCGHVEEEDYSRGPDDDLDAVYARVAARELEEELGVAPPLTPIWASAPIEGVHYEHLRLFRGIAPGPYRIQAAEVAEVRALTREELLTLLQDPGAKVTHTLRFFTDWLERNGGWPSGA
jgi:isopentenyldiphosphate isomerase